MPKRKGIAAALCWDLLNTDASISRRDRIRVANHFWSSWFISSGRDTNQWILKGRLLGSLLGLDFDGSNIKYKRLFSASFAILGPEEDDFQEQAKRLLETFALFGDIDAFLKAAANILILGSFSQTDEPTIEEKSS